MDSELEFAIQTNTNGKQLFDQVGNVNFVVESILLSFSLSFWCKYGTYVSVNFSLLKAYSFLNYRSDNIVFTYAYSYQWRR